MKIRDSVAFVTGANRGLGLAFVQVLLAAGARKVYAAARKPETIPLDGAHRVRLDVTDGKTIAAMSGCQTRTIDCWAQAMTSPKTDRGNRR